METWSRSDHVSSVPLEKKKAKKQSSNSTQKQTKEKNKSRATKCALQRKVLSKDGHSNRWLMKKVFFRAMLVLGVRELSGRKDHHFVVDHEHDGMRSVRRGQNESGRCGRM